MALTIKQQMEANSKAWHTADATTRKQLEATNQKLGSQLGASYDSKTGTWADKSGGSLYKPVTTPAPTSSVQQKMQANSAAWHTADASTRKKLEAENQTLGTQLGKTYDPKTGTWSGGTAPATTTAPTTPDGATKTTINRNGQTISGYIYNGQTYDDQGKRVTAGDVVNAANGSQYFMTEAGKGVDVKNTPAANLYGKDSALGMPNLSKSVGQTYMLDGKYYDAKSGKLAGAGYIDMGNGTYYDTETGQTITQDVINMTQQKAQLEAELAAMQQAQLEANQAAVDAAQQQLLANQEQGVQELDEAAAQSEIDSYKMLDNLALRSARMGDQGGIGQKQYGEAANANDKRILEISLEKKNLESSTKQQIAQLQAQGKMNEAQIISDLGMKQIAMLTEEEDKLRALQKEQELTNAELLGTYKGQPTLQTQQTNYNRALQRLQLGIFSEQDAALLGVPADQAKMFANTINIMAQIDLAQAQKKLAEVTGAVGAGTSGTASTGPAASMGYQSTLNNVKLALSGRNTADPTVFNKVVDYLQNQTTKGVISEAEAENILTQIGLK